jgi:DNA-binding CsgD family transcriptional regulator
MLDAQLNLRCLEVLHAKTVSEYKRLNVDFVRSLGFHTVAATVVTDHSPHLTEFQSVTNAPSDYMPSFEDMASAKLDPVSQHCKKSSTPIVWDQDVYVAHGRGDYWEHQAAFGYLSGISVAFHLPWGRHFMFGIDCDRRVCASKRDLRNVLWELHTFAAHSQAAAFYLCTPYPPSGSEEGLAPSELDALRRSMDGLNNREVGSAMGISETEVLLRLRRAIQKLGCTNKYEAALRAIRLGLVDCS